MCGAMYCDNNNIWGEFRDLILGFRLSRLVFYYAFLLVLTTRDRRKPAESHREYRLCTHIFQIKTYTKNQIFFRVFLARRTYRIFKLPPTSDDFCRYFVCYLNRLYGTRPRCISTNNYQGCVWREPYFARQISYYEKTVVFAVLFNKIARKIA